MAVEDCRTLNARRTSVYPPKLAIKATATTIVMIDTRTQ